MRLRTFSERHPRALAATPTLILRSRAQRGASKDGGELRTCDHPSRRALRAILRMRAGVGFVRLAISAMSDSLAELKAIVRKDALMRRDALPAAERASAAEAIAARAFPIALTAGTIVSGFMPLKTEINPLPLMRKLSQSGASLALPAIAGRGHPL